MATLTKTLKLPFLRLNRSKTEMFEFERLQKLNTEVAHSILALPKTQRRTLTTKVFANIESVRPGSTRPFVTPMPAQKSSASRA
ncbi:MAG: hypothetical protein Q6J46_11710, partial [Thermostichus sp. DG02_2_bins_29]